jgi:hypothetical protein
MKRWLLLLPAVLFGCPQFAPDDVCGYPGFCDGSIGTDAGDAGKDGGATCPSGKEPKDDPTCVTETLGIFVAPTGNDSNAGTKSAPVATLKTALQKVGTKSFIFVCEGSYSESVDITQSASIFGGFACTDWSYSPTTLPKFTATKPDYVFHLDGADDTVIGDLELDAMDGAAGTGQSSVGMFVANSQNVKVERLTIHAGMGADGVDGKGTSLGAQWPDGGALAGHNATASSGGTANMQACPGATSTTGGKGGNGTLNSSFNNGDPGLPSLGGGSPGDGGATCSNGGTGGNGDAGANGTGATSVGDIIADGGWQPSAGSEGDIGGPGQGGGGGGGSDNGSFQGGGGGGGAGGCGGGFGGAGSGGGGSVAVAVLTSSISITSTTILCDGGGKGGNGVVGESGQKPGGSGGTPAFPGCSGGGGGNGGGGGGGGGGAGGVSIGVVSKGGAVTIDSFTQGHITTGTPGAKGAGAAGNDGIAGVADASLTL